METVREIWDRIEAELGRMSPRVRAALPAGATEEEIRAAEAAMGVELPEEVRESYRRHNGLPGVRIRWQDPLYSLDEMVADWRWRADDVGDFDDEDAEEDGVIRRKVAWSAGWIPILNHGNGDVDCIDLDPPAPERLGQIIDWTHEGWTADYVTTGLRALLAELATDLETGRYEVDEAGDSSADDDLPRLNWLGD
ncbi:SMI1/KNR4 family protein [Kitasatospora sp. McL0602]|uniref:SMI1/KNR4 family protein n=1 Tax=Kitasatospora sp. McL0602 TaxID=3439530 RepID=UPI003F8C6079